MKFEEWANQLLPLGGNLGVRDMATVAISPAATTSVDLRTLFGNIDNGHFFTFKADAPFQAASGTNWKAYFSLSDKAGNINHGFSGAGGASGIQGWPLTDGQEKSGHLISGRIVTTGMATAIDFRVVNALCNVGSGLLRIMRSTLPPGQDASQLRVPVPSAIFPPGPSGWQQWP